MLNDIDAMPMLAVKNLEVANDFYEGTLGLEQAAPPQDGMVPFKSGNAVFVLYESEYAGTNQANALAWSLGGEFDSVIEQLRKHGVTFEHYDLPGLSLEGDVHVAENFKGVWFKDPDGNILHMNQQ